MTADFLDAITRDIRTENRYNAVKTEFLGAYNEECVNLKEIASVANHHSGKLLPLVKPKSFCLRVCGQDGTVYAGNEDQLEAWKDYYLPERMEMEVIGAIDDFACEAFGLQLVLMVCEDGKIYAYEYEVLHLVARSLRELFDTGMTFPGIETYKEGECFEDYTEEEYNEMMESEEIKEMKEAHSKFRESLELEMLESLKQFKTSKSKVCKEDEEFAKEDSSFPNKSEVNKYKNTDVSVCKDIVIWPLIYPNKLRCLVNVLVTHYLPHHHSGRLKLLHMTDSQQFEYFHCLLNSTTKGSRCKIASHLKMS